MVRHTRNRQMDKLTIKKNNWKGMANITIERMRKDEKAAGDLDATFTWHRNFEGWGYNVVEFGGTEDTYGTCFPAKTKGW
ncbi:hypothetical protein CHOTACABRAS_25 [Bacillus phage Chotacabras]|nr:hypothetical protein CHOTACABRAS_25 [Bacillus phage Chotacabras]